MFVDIHSHILPLVDDGAQSIDEALELLRLAKKDGIEYLVLTPHFIYNGEFKLKKEEILEHYIQFKKIVAANGIDISLFLGNEIFIDSKIDDLLTNGDICSLNKTKYVLVEFPFDTYKNEYDETLYNLTLCGYKVIIAHPERYSYVRNDINFCKRWLKESYLLQCNQNSLFNDNKKHTFKMIENGWVSFIASDAHNVYRPCQLSDAYKVIRKKYSEEIADKLFYQNGIDLLCGKNI